MLEVYALKDADAARLMKETGVGPGLYANVRGLVQSGVARFDGLMVNTAAPGKHGEIKQVDALHAPARFHAPLAAGELPFPILFEEKQAGENLEYEADLAQDGSGCDLKLTFSTERLSGFSALSQYPNLPVAPIMNLQKIQTQLGLGFGVMAFVGDLTPAGQTPKDGIRRWVFGRADLQPVAPAKEPGGPAATAPVFNPIARVYSLEREEARQLLEARPADCYDAVRKLANDNQARLEAETPEEVVKVDSGKSYGIDVSTGELKIPRAYELTVDGTNSQARSTTRQSSFVELGSAIGYPVDFVTRPLGLQFEIQPTALPDGTVAVIAEPSFVQRFGQLRGDDALETLPAQPVAVLQSARTVLSMTPGVFSLVGTLNPPGENGVNDRRDSGRVWLCFLRVDRVKEK